MFMSQQSVDRYKKKPIITNFEIVGLFIGFALVLFILFPKHSMKEQILNEKSNYDLTAIYLHNLIKLEPKNSPLVLEMAKVLYNQGKYDLSRNLLDAIEKGSSDFDILQKVALLKLTINNRYLEKKIDEKKREAILRDNRSLLKRASNIKSCDLNSSKTLYFSALSLGERESALRFNINILKNIPKDEQVKWLKNLHYLAYDLNKTNIDKETLKILLREDKKERFMWLKALLSMQSKEENRAINPDKLGLSDSQKAYFYLSTNQIHKATKLYQSLFKEAKTIDKKREYLQKIIDELRANNQVKKAAKIASEYEDSFLDDSDMLKRLLSLYIEAARSDLAKQLSLKIMDKRGIK